MNRSLRVMRGGLLGLLLLCVALRVMAWLIAPSFLCWSYSQPWSA